MSENDPFFDRLNDFLDGGLDDVERLPLERHLGECSRCRIALEELRAVVDTARETAHAEPPESAWRSISVALAGRARSGGGGAQHYFYGALTLAASLVLGMGLYLLTRPAEPTVPDPEALVTMVSEELRAAESHYQKAIDGLEQIIDANEGVLSPELSTVLNENLDLIESAIHESRAAIATQPESTVAQESLLEALRRKVTLLQKTILLINEVRKGEGENAMDIIDEMRGNEAPSNPI